MTINLTDQIRISPALPLRRIAVFVGSTLPLELRAIPAMIGEDAVTAVQVTITNADGFRATVQATAHPSVWLAAFAPSCFAAWGHVEKGVKITATLTTPQNAARFITLAVGDLDILPDSATARKGDGSAAFAFKGDDIFIKSEVVEDVQHYKRVTIAYNERLAAWGFNDPEGDYILAPNGDFQEVTP